MDSLDRLSEGASRNRGIAESTLAFHADRTRLPCALPDCYIGKIDPQDNPVPHEL